MSNRGNASRHKRRSSLRGDSPLKIEPAVKSLLEIDPTLNESSFARGWQTLVLSGHGTLKEGGTVLIPPRTFILFNAPSGCRATYINGLPFTDLLVSDFSSYPEKMMKEIRNPKGLMPDPKVMEPLNSDIYPHVNLSGANSSYYSTAHPKMTADQITRAIFTPGTSISDMTISFSNNADVRRALILGVYEAPLSPQIMEPLRQIPSGPAEVEYFDRSVFGNEHFGNMLPRVIGHTRDLSELLDMLPPPPAGKNRLLFITACRGMEYPAHMAHLRAPYSRLARRYSLSLRRKKPNYSALHQMEEVPLLRRAGILDEATLLPSRANMNLNVAAMNRIGMPMRNRRILHRALTRRRGALSNSNYRPPGLIGPTLPPDHPLYAQHGPWF